MLQFFTIFSLGREHVKNKNTYFYKFRKISHIDFEHDSFGKSRYISSMNIDGQYQRMI